MKKRISITGVALIALVIFSCKKNATSNLKTETPIQATVESKLVVDTSVAFANSSWEFGNKFYSSRNGNITKLGCKMGSIGNFRVTLWDFTTKNLIAATTISITDSSMFVYNSISPVAITANTRYLVSMNNTSGAVHKNYNLYYSKNAPNVSRYPFTSGSITFENVQESNSAVSVFPEAVNVFSQPYIIGLADFQFEYSE
jgi:hypothetical protein